MNKGDLLRQIIEDLSLIQVETTLIAGAILLLIVGLIRPAKRITKGLYALILGTSFLFLLQSKGVGEAMSSSLFIPSYSFSFSTLFLLSGLLILLFPRDKKHSTEFYFFIISILAGSLFIMKANSLLIVYLAVELVSFSSYILTNFSFRKQGNEAGMKYLLFGAISSSIMLFGLALVYGTTETFYLSEWSSADFAQIGSSLGLLLMLFGLFFKASLFPFHIWVPATYQSAPNDAVALMSIVPKIAALILIKRIIVDVDGSLWIVNVCLILGLLTMLFGTFGALRQNNVRRMISFGAIAHSGFLLPFAVMNSETAASSFWLYSSVYAIMNIAIFYLIDFYEEKGIFQLHEYGSLGARLPVLGFATTIVLVSLIGIPPVAGFTAKFLLFTSLWEFYASNQQSIYLIYLFISVLVTVVSLFFYFKIPYHMYLVKSTGFQSIDSSRSTKIIATLFSIALLLLFFAPEILTVMQQLLNKLAS